MLKREDVLEYEQPTKYIVTNEKYNNSYNIPVLTANKGFILGYTNESFGIYSKQPCILFDDFTCDIKFVNFNFKVKSSAIKILTSLENANILFLYYLMLSNNYTSLDHQRHWIKHISKKNIYVPCIEEQFFISSLFKKIDEKISVVKNKMQTLKKYKEGLIRIGLKLLYKSNYSAQFSDIFEKLNIRNKSNLDQYTVGKEGLKKLKKTNYDLSKHILFYPYCLLIGLGIEELAVSENEEGSISPVYNVYKLKDKDYLIYCKYFLKPYLWRQKDFITRKSTRRQYEIDINVLEKLNLPIFKNNENCISLYNAITHNDNKIAALEEKLKNTINYKKYLLENMFI